MLTIKDMNIRLHIANFKQEKVNKQGKILKETSSY